MPDSSVELGAIVHQLPQFHSHSTVAPRENPRQESNRIGHIRRYESGLTIIPEGGESTIAGRVTSGIVRITQTLDDGRQQVVGLALPGDYFGHFFHSGAAFTYEAATAVEACVFPQMAFEALLVTDHELKHRVMISVLRDLELSREWMMVLGCQNTLERVVSFMLHIHKRMRVAGLMTNEDTIEFPISRRDIAAYLGTTVETISRHVQALARQRIIKILDNSHFRICNLGRLQSLSKQHWDGMELCGSGSGTRVDTPFGRAIWQQSRLA